MFTGIIEEIGIIQDVYKEGKSSQINIKANKVLKDLKIGQSVAINGVCLTVVALSEKSFVAQVMPETMSKSNLSEVKKGMKVNLERAMRLGDRLGGHIVSGHIDGIGILDGYEGDENAIWIKIKAPLDILKYVVYKGSITIDGVSLTVAYVDETSFMVSIIPHTQKESTLTRKNIGNNLNLECDILSKYVEKLMNFQPKEEKKQFNLTKKFLEDNGFL